MATPKRPSARAKSPAPAQLGRVTSFEPLLPPGVTRIDKGGRMPVSRVDGWQNVITASGTKYDKLGAANWERGTRVDPFTLESLYYENDFVAKIVDSLPDHALRQGIELDLTSSEEDDDTDAKTQKEAATRIETRMRELDVLGKFRLAAKWGRLFGGGAIILGAVDGKEPKEELNPDKSKGLAWMTVVDRRELFPFSYYADPSSPKFGQVAQWTFQPFTIGSTDGAVVVAPDAARPGVIIHESRIVQFEGLPASRIERMRQGGWSLSVIQRVIDVLSASDQNWRSLSLILQNAAQGIFKMKGLIEALANGDKATILERFEMMAQGKSISRDLTLDAEGEDFEWASIPLSGLDVLMDKTWQRVAAAAGMPMTLLMGTSPAGMNATGESDMRQWYDSVQSYRSDVLDPRLVYVIRLLAKEVNSPGDWRIVWPSLWQMSPTEEATYRKTVADTDAVYLQNQVVTPEEIAASRFGGDKFSADTVVDFELRERAEQAEQGANPQASGDVASLAAKAAQLGIGGKPTEDKPEAAAGGSDAA